jgi:hypothetical protein
MNFSLQGLKELLISFLFFFPYGSTALMGPRPPSCSRFHDHTHLRHTTIGRTPLDEGPARRRDLT